MTTGAKHSYFVHIDGMRALAVLSVIIYHLHGTWLPGGFAGVDVFFVISGFVVTASVSELKLGLRQFLVYFYARRVQRIVPALMVCLVLSSLVAALFIPTAWLSNKNQITGMAAFWGFSNIVLAHGGNDYFSPTAEYNPYTHTWSLGVEEQFYLIFPLLFSLWMAGGKGRTRSLRLFVLVALASAALSFWLVRHQPLLAFYMIFSRFWELAGGVMLYQWISQRGAVLPPRAASVGLTLSLLLVGYGLIFSDAAQFPFPGALPIVAGTLGLLFCLHESAPHGWIKRLLSSAPAVYIGKISYSLYLWHWPVFVLFKWTVGTESALCRVVALALAFTLAIASYYLVELRVRNSSVLHTLRRSYRLMGGLTLIVVCFGVSAVIMRAQARLSLSTVSRNVSDWDPHQYQSGGSGVCQIKASEVGYPGGKALVMLPGSCGTRIVPHGRLFVLGDSHAGHYNVMLRSYVQQTGTEVHIYSTGGCAFLGLRQPMEESGPCHQASQVAVNDLLTRVRAGDTLFLSSLRLPRYGDQWVKFDEDEMQRAAFGPTAEAERSAAERQAVAILRPFADKGVRIIFPGPTPVFRSPAFRCSDWFNRSNPICAPGDSVARAEIERLRTPVLHSFDVLKADLPGIRVWDPMPLLCPDTGSVCRASVAGQPLFFDGDHLSAHANMLLLPGFSAFMLAPGAPAGRLSGLQAAAANRH